jgi:hypothetical protein
MTDLVMTVANGGGDDAAFSDFAEPKQVQQMNGGGAENTVVSHEAQLYPINGSNSNESHDLFAGLPSGEANSTMMQAGTMFAKEEVTESGNFADVVCSDVKESLVAEDNDDTSGFDEYEDAAEALVDAANETDDESFGDFEEPMQIIDTNSEHPSTDLFGGWDEPKQTEIVEPEQRPLNVLQFPLVACSPTGNGDDAFGALEAPSSGTKIGNNGADVALAAAGIDDRDAGLANVDTIAGAKASTVGDNDTGGISDSAPTAEITLDSGLLCAVSDTTMVGTPELGFGEPEIVEEEQGEVDAARAAGETRQDAFQVTAVSNSAEEAVCSMESIEEDRGGTSDAPIATTAEDFGEFGSSREANSAEEEVGAGDLDSAPPTVESFVAKDQVENFNEFGAVPHVVTEGATTTPEAQVDVDAAPNEANVASADDVDFGAAPNSEVESVQEEGEEFGGFGAAPNVVTKATVSEDKDDSGDFDTTQNEEVESAGVEENDDDFGDFDAAPNTAVEALSVDNDDDFGNFNAAPATSDEAAGVKLADDFGDEEDDFGDFDAAPVTSADTANDDDFGDFDAAAKETGRNGVDEDEDDFGDFDEAPTISSSPAEPTSVPTSEDPVLQKLRLVFPTLFARYGSGGDESSQENKSDDCSDTSSLANDVVTVRSVLVSYGDIELFGNAYSTRLVLRLTSCLLANRHPSTRKQKDT